MKQTWCEQISDLLQDLRIHFTFWSLISKSTEKSLGFSEQLALHSTKCSKHSACWLLLQLWVLNTSECLSWVSQNPRLHHQWPPKESLYKSLAQNQLIKPQAKRDPTQFFKQHSWDYLPHHPHFTIFLFLQQVNRPYLYTQGPSLHILDASLDNKKWIQAFKSSKRLCCC